MRSFIVIFAGWVLLFGLTPSKAHTAAPTQVAWQKSTITVTKQSTVASSAAQKHERMLDAALGATTLLDTLLVGWSGYLRRQISKRERAERALADQLAFMHTLINGNPHPIYVFDTNHHLLACNERFLQEIGARREQVMGKSLEESGIISAEIAHRFQAVHERSLFDKHALFTDRDCLIWGSQRKIHHWVLPYTNTAGQIVGTIGGWIDISDRIRLLQALRRAKELAESATKAKSAFLAIASHEIRTPMNAISGMLELALQEETASGQDANDYVRVAHNSAQALLALASDLLDLEKIHAGKLELRPERNNLQELTEGIVQLFSGLASSKGINLQLKMSGHASADILIDATRYKQILSNLISNAIKFTHVGQVTVFVEVQPGESERLTIKTIVKDTGIGISKTDQQKLFAPFVQTADGARVFGGSGLGLSIARQITSLMGGSMHLHSVPGQGCEVQCEFEASRLAPQAKIATTLQQAPPPHKTLYVLIVDDNSPSRLLLRKQLERLGHHVISAESGSAAWHLWRPGAYDLVITDCNMAAGNGYVLARHIREAESRHAGHYRCTIWAYTANAQPEEIQRCQRAGMDDCLFKPSSLAQLQHRFESQPLPAQPLHPAWREGLHFDPIAIENLAAGDRLTANRFLEELINSNAGDNQALQAALEINDHDALLAAIHAVIGVARIVNAVTLVDVCTQAQQTLSDHRNRADAHQTCAAVLSELEAMSVSIKAWLKFAPQSGNFSDT